MARASLTEAESSSMSITLALAALGYARRAAQTRGSIEVLGPDGSAAFVGRVDAVWAWLRESGKIVANSWVAVGARVDYHSIIGGPITQRDLVVRAGPQWMGGSWVVWLTGKAGCVAVEACTPVEGSPGSGRFA